MFYGKRENFSYYFNEKYWAHVWNAKEKVSFDVFNFFFVIFRFSSRFHSECIGPKAVKTINEDTYTAV